MIPRRPPRAIVIVVRRPQIWLLAIAGSVIVAIMLTIVLNANRNSASSQPPPPATFPTAHAPASPDLAVTSASTSVPRGWQRIGGSVQGVSLAVPGMWVTVNFAQLNLQQAIKHLVNQGFDERTAANSLQSLWKAHAVYAADIKRHCHPAAPPGPGPPAALVHLAPPPPVPRPPSPPALERLRRNNSMITTNYSCRR